MCLLTNVPQVFCQTMAGAEFAEALEGLRRRYEELGLAFPGIATVDNCCTVEAIIKAVFPEIEVKLDVHHFVMRSVSCRLSCATERLTTNHRQVPRSGRERPQESAPCRGRSGHF